MAPTRDEMRHALSNQHDLQSRLSKAINTINIGNFSKTDILHQLFTMRENITGAGSFLSSVIPPELYNERRLPDSTIAREVLQIPELLELILKHTTFWDVYNIYHTSRGLRAIVEASSILQDKMFLRLAATTAQKQDATPPRGSPWCYFCHKPHQARQPGWSRFHPMAQRVAPRKARSSWFDVHFNDDACKDELWASFTQSKRKRGLPRVGVLWKRMQICEPPITSVFILAYCKCYRRRRPRRLNGDLQVANDGRITFGELYDKAEDIFKRNGECLKCNDPSSTWHYVTFTKITRGALDKLRDDYWQPFSEEELATLELSVEAASTVQFTETDLALQFTDTDLGLSF